MQNETIQAASRLAMKDKDYWKNHYVTMTKTSDIERSMNVTSFGTGAETFELVFFDEGKNAPNILISQGSGGHSYIFAELGYLMHLRGYNVFIMPKHGGFTVNQLLTRHVEALNHISKTFNSRTGVYAEGLGGFVAFYLALAHGPARSIACQNSPAILTERAFHYAIMSGGKGSAKRRRRLFPLLRIAASLFPWLTLSISTYLDWRELVDTKEENRGTETRLVESFMGDPDFDKRYPLPAIMSLLTTPPPNEIGQLRIPTMFLVALRGFSEPSYFLDLYHRLPLALEKRLVEVDGSVYWMLSHPREAAETICAWFDRTL